MRSRKFWLFVIAVLAVEIALQAGLLPESWSDELIALGIGLTLVVGAIGMMVVRRDWTARALGILGVFLGTGVFYLEVFGFRRGWFALDADHLNPVRALLLVAGPLFDIGLLRWLLSYPRSETIEVTPRRRASDWGKG